MDRQHWISDEPEWTETHEQVYRALYKAGDQIGARELDKQAKAWKGAKKRFRFTVSPEHRAIVDMLGELSRLRVEPAQAMALLHTYDIDMARFGKRVLTA